MVESTIVEKAPRPELSDALKATIQTAYREWLSARGFRPRQGQRQMIASVARTLTASEGRVGVVEAGTGTGKTVAYCLAAIPIAKALRKRLVVSSATVALQEQIAFRDLPDLAAGSSLEFDYLLAKGRRRYVCLKRLDQMLTGKDGGSFGLFDAEEPAGDVSAEDLLDAFAAGRWDGDVDNWDGAIDAQLWSSLTTDHRGCANFRCEFFQQCPYFRARGAMESADVVVANHDLVLADLGLGGGAVLTEPEDTIYIVDEAHHLAATAQSHYSLQMGCASTRRWLQQLAQLIGSISSVFEGPQELEAIVRRSTETENALAHLGELEQALAGLDLRARDDSVLQHRFVLGEVPDAVAAIARELASWARTVAGDLHNVVDMLNEVVDGTRMWPNASEAVEWLGAVSQQWRRADAICGLLRDYSAASASSETESSSSPRARWVTAADSIDGFEYQLHSSPLVPDEILQQVFWDRAFAVLLTSATLSSLGRFDRFLDSVGLNKQTETLRIPSPFNFSEVASLVVPAMDSDPRVAAAHTDEIGRRLPEWLATESSALVLFSSWRQFRAVRDLLPEAVVEVSHFQGDTQKRRLVEQHCERIDAGKPSYLMGLRSFAEGLDLPGAYCRHVIICKLPFSVPDDPLYQALSEYLERDGKNPFFTVALPDAALRLVQACGRLIRSDDDFGRITLLDRRIVSARYGRDLIRSLPPYRLVVETE
jgi:ATP-dependent DNA helicase DinG